MLQLINQRADGTTYFVLTGCDDAEFAFARERACAH